MSRDIHEIDVVFKNLPKDKTLYWVSPNGNFHEVTSVRDIDDELCVIFPFGDGYAEVPNTEEDSFVLVTSLKGVYV